MLDKFLGGTSDIITERLAWTWANGHPYLYTIIEVAKPSLVLVIIYVGLKITQAIFRKN